MRAINNLVDVQIVLRELLDKKDRDLAKAKDQRGLQIKNAGDATDPQDLVTLRQLDDIITRKITNTIIINKAAGSGGGGTGPQGPPGPAGPPGPSGVANGVQETPSGTLNGTNTIFTISFIPITDTFNLELNGVEQNFPGDATLVGTTITYLVAPKATDWHTAKYFR